MTFNLQIFGGSGAGSGKGGGGGNEQETYVRGVPQSQIDQLRDTRRHLSKDKLTPDVIKDDYERVGIKISIEEAREIHKALKNFTGSKHEKMRNALFLEREGKGNQLSNEQKELLRQYKLCIEYCKVAPTYHPKPSENYIHRGLQAGKYSDYGEKMATLKAGDKWDAGKTPTSFTTHYGTAYTFAGAGFYERGVIIHAPTKNLKNSPSIAGLSHIYEEKEIFLSDYKWKVARKESKLNEMGNEMVHIYLEPDD